MTLPASGLISLGNNTGDTTTISVNRELGKASPWQQTVTLNDSNVRSLFGKPGSGNTISMSDGWGKSAISITVPALGAFGTAYPGQTAYGELIFNSNGTIQAGTSNIGIQSAGNWATPTTTGIGSSYWVRFTQTGSYGTGGFGGATQYGSAKGVWHQISSTLYFGVQRTGNGMGGFYYTVQIASDSGGSNILATRTDVEVAAEIIF